MKRSLLIKEGEDNGRLMGSFANRRFYKDEIIGIYLGKFRKETEDDGPYAYQLGNIDAVQGLDGKPFMGMHFMNDPFLGGKQTNINPNAVGWETCEVKATATIIEGEEFLLDYQERVFQNQPRKKSVKKGAKKGAVCYYLLVVIDANCRRGTMKETGTMKVMV